MNYTIKFRYNSFGSRYDKMVRGRQLCLAGNVPWMTNEQFGKDKSIS